ncbi:MAG: tRNA (adenosine(37)-N6)-threonylcarbamoyltransferase complex dimerization subunit type 1 TsaB [Treponema sp.]|jgi:tRNA threonylcarbamoyladenosine biosynthesis protein TsaB|nr:tRNA (adenosine(37)-N6)-threonylcarbamoyltransferase complex dimerization subunit type 1 TsaB [Treponema sp.]
MNILALDTATPVLSIALSNGEHAWYFEADAGNRHSEIIMDAIDMLLSKSGMQSKDLDLAACMKGPGSFTGLRIGYSIVKGLCLPSGIAMAAVGTLDCVAYFRRDWNGFVVPAIDAKKHAYFTALFEKGVRLSEDMDAGVERIAGLITGAASRAASESPVLLTGVDAAPLYEELKRHLPVEKMHLDAGCLENCRQGYAKALLALAPRHIEKNPLSAPEYKRKSDAEIEAGKQAEQRESLPATGAAGQPPALFPY